MAVVTSPSTAGAVLVATDRELLARGVSSYLAERLTTGSVVTARGRLRPPIALPVGQVRLVLADVQSCDPTDRLAGCDRIAHLRADPRCRHAPVVALVDRPPCPVVQLRLVEAGADRWLRTDDLLRHPELMTDLLGSPDADACGLVPRLAERATLRAALQLRPDGDLHALAVELRHVPAHVWTDGRNQDELPLSRRSLQRVRRIADEIGGLPPPDPSRFTTVFRSAPQHPQWGAVRHLARAVFGLPAETAEPTG